MHSDFLSHCRSGNFALLSSMLEVEPSLLNKQDERLGLTPLFHAILLKDLNLLQFLLRKGAEVNRKSASGDTLLHEAVENGLPEMVDILSKAGAKVNATNGEEDTALHIAAFRGDKLSMKLLIYAGANLNMRNLAYKTPLHVAVSEMHYSCVSLLLKAGANPALVNSDLLTPADLAQKNGLQHLFVGASRGSLLVDYDLDSIKEVTDDDLVSLVSEKFLFEEPDAESDTLRSTGIDLASFLSCHGLEDCTEPLERLGIDSLDRAVQAMKGPCPLTINFLKENGVKQVGRAAALLIKLDEEAGVLQNMQVVYGPHSRQMSLSCYDTFVAEELYVNSVSFWLETLGLQEEASKFEKAGYFELDVLFKQMHSRFPFDEPLLREIGVDSEKHRLVILAALKEEAKLFIGKELDLPIGAFGCGCSLL